MLQVTRTSDQLQTLMQAALDSKMRLSKLCPCLTYSCSVECNIFCTCRTHTVGL
jgi:hypothetical protein